MKRQIAPWKIKARDVIEGACRKWRSNLQWRCAPVVAWSNYVTLTVNDERVTACAEINIRLVWKRGRLGDFSYLNTCIGRLMDHYYAKHAALLSPSNAAAQAWTELVTPTEEKREIA